MKLTHTSFCLAAAIALAFSLPAARTARAQSGILLKTFNVKAGRLLLDPNRPRLYATLPQDNSLAVIDTDTNAVLTTLFIGSQPADLAISPDGMRLYIANRGSTTGAIGVVDLDTLAALPSLSAPFAPVSIAAGRDNRLYLLAAAYYFANGQAMPGLAQIDASTGTLSTLFGPFQEGGNLQISPDGNTLYCQSGGLRSYDVSTATPSALQTSSYDIETGILALSHHGQFLVSPCSGGNGGYGYQTYLLHTSNLNEMLGSFDVGAYPGPATFSPDDSLLFQSRTQGSSAEIEVFSTRTYAQIANINDPGASSRAFGSSVNSLAYSPARGYLYVAADSDAYGANGPANLELISTRPGAFFDGSVALTGGFYYLKFADGVPFGYFNVNYSPYLYHADLGFVFPYDAADGSGGIYLYDFTSKTFWYTSASLFPYLYDFTLNTFLYYYPDPSNPDHYNTRGVRYFYNFATGKIIRK